MKYFIISICSIFLFLGCRTVDESINPGSFEDGKFQLTFKSSGEVILDDTHLETYEIKEGKHYLYLNTSGVEKINSYIDWFTQHNPPTPNPAKLYQKEFTVKFDGKELYSGKFFSAISSQFYPGYIIMDVYLFTSSKILTIETCYPTSEYFTGNDARYNKELIEYLKIKGKYKSSD